MGLQGWVGFGRWTGGGEEPGVTKHEQSFQAARGSLGGRLLRSGVNGAGGRIGGRIRSRVHSLGPKTISWSGLLDSPEREMS